LDWGFLRMIVKKFTVTFKKKFIKISSTFLFLLFKLILKNMKKIITILAVLFGLAAVFYAGMTFKQTLYEDWCILL
jgi:hypothetical protein